jgi:hypothetical protein
MKLKSLLLTLAAIPVLASCGPSEVSLEGAKNMRTLAQPLAGEKWYGSISYEHHEWHRLTSSWTGCISGSFSSSKDELIRTLVSIAGDDVTYHTSTNGSYKATRHQNQCVPECYETEVTTKSRSGSGTTDAEYNVSIKEGVGRFDVEPQGEILGHLSVTNEYSNCLDNRTSTHEEFLNIAVLVSGEGTVEPGSKPGTFILQGERVEEGSAPGTAEPPRWTDTTKWYLTNNPEELVVDVEVVEYADWRPEGSLVANTAGNHIEVKATLRQANGGPPRELALNFTFELVEVSKIPGVAMNFPPPPYPRNEPDLQFDPLVNPDMLLTPSDYSTAKTPDGEYDSSSVAVGAYDWGAHGILLVTARMKNGRQIVGRLKGTTETRIRLPKRGPSSFIADAWKEDEKVTSQPDDFDEEGPADIDGHTGDGLTLFEEYRGFIIDGEWTSGAPTNRDLFIYNRVGDDVVPGFGIHANASGLALHEIRSADEAGRERVINFNPHPQPNLHKVDQHLVKIVRLVTQRKAPFTRTRTGGPTVPQNVIQLEIPSTYSRRGSAGSTTPAPGIIPNSEFDVAIAHELGHANNVHHHGDVDLQKVVWQADGTGIAETSSVGVTKPLRIFEDTPALTELFIPAAQLPVNLDFVSRTGGQHSGDTGCVMRYAFARASVSIANPNHRLVPTTPEPFGQGLCTSRMGTDFNAPGRRPQPRHGDASPNRGNCLHQVCVNDFFHTHLPR